MRRLVTLLLIVVAAHASAQRRRAVDPVPELRILFIGNSLTYTNDLPAIVCRLAAAGGKRAVCESVTGSGYALEDHFGDGRAARRLREEKWSIVVLQQGPSALEESRVNLRQWTAQFAPLIRAAGAQPALFAVWPEKARSFDFARVSQSYRLAASDVGGLFFPAGDAWLAAWRHDPKLALYSPDDFHPSATGSYEVKRGTTGAPPAGGHGPQRLRSRKSRSVRKVRVQARPTDAAGRARPPEALSSSPVHSASVSTG